MEKLRVLNREGKIISVSAGEDHLSELKDILYSVRTEKKKEAIESQFNNNEIEAEKINEVSLQLEQIIADLEQKEERWLELSMKME